MHRSIETNRLMYLAVLLIAAVAILYTIGCKQEEPAPPHFVRPSGLLAWDIEVNTDTVFVRGYAFQRDEQLSEIWRVRHEMFTQFIEEQEEAVRRADAAVKTIMEQRLNELRLEKEAIVPEREGWPFIVGLPYYSKTVTGLVYCARNSRIDCDFMLLVQSPDQVQLMEATQALDNVFRDVAGNGVGVLQRSGANMFTDAGGFTAEAEAVLEALKSALPEEAQRGRDTDPK